MQWEILAPPTTTPVSIEQAMVQAGIDDIPTYRQWTLDAINDATSYAETQTQLSFITRTLSATYYPNKSDQTPQANPFPPYTCLPLFRGPLQGVTGIVDGYSNMVSYQLRTVGMVDFVQLNGSIIGPITVIYTAGYGATATDVPGDIRRAIVAHVSHMWRYREADADSVPTGLESIYGRYRAGGIG